MGQACNQCGRPDGADYTHVCGAGSAVVVVNPPFTVSQHLPGCPRGERPAEDLLCECIIIERRMLRARVATLEAALRPFAEAKEPLHAYEPDNLTEITRCNYDAGITLGDLRRARAALAQPVGGKT